MKKRKKTALAAICLCLCLAVLLFPGCGNSKMTTDAGINTDAQTESENGVNAYGLADGMYIADFTTDNSMFHVSDAYDNKGILTVENGEMTIHVSLQSKNIVNLFPGSAEDAQKEGAELLQPTTDTVNYSDGTSKEVYGFDIPVPAIGEEFDVALIGTHGNWYDHKVLVANPAQGSEIPAAE